MVKIKKKTEPVESVHTIRSPYYKKLTALVLMGALAAGTVFTGCGKKDIDYVDGGSGGGDSGSLQSKYGIPESCDTTLNSGSSGISKLAIEADEIQVPDTADLPIVYVKKKDMTDDTKKQITESIFEKEKGIYAYDSEHLIKTDLQAEIDMYEQQKKNSAANGDTSSASWYDSMIDELKDQMQTAPDEYPAATDFSGDNYLGERNDRQYLLNIGMSDGAASGYLGLKDSLITYRPKDGADGVYYSAPDTGEDLSSVDAAQTNACIFSQEEAQSIAEEFIASLGITDVTLKDSQDLYWYYYGTDGSTTSVDIDGYVFLYTKAINNQSTESPKLWNVDNLTQDKADVEVPSESCEINVDSNGVLSASWVDFLEFTDKTESKELLSFDELLKKADKNIAEYYTTYPAQYKRIEYNDMKLGYYLEKTDEDGMFRYVPAWILTEYTDTIDGSDNQNYPTQMVVLDATDGSVIDLMELSKALGGYQVYDDETVTKSVSGEDSSSISAIGDADAGGSEDSTDDAQTE